VVSFGPLLHVWRAMAIPYNLIGKNGTTQNNGDGWFIWCIARIGGWFLGQVLFDKRVTILKLPEWVLGKYSLTYCRPLFLKIELLENDLFLTRFSV